MLIYQRVPPLKKNNLTGLEDHGIPSGELT